MSVLGLGLGVGLNVIGLDVSRWLHNIGAVSSWAPAVLVVMLAPLAWFRFGSATDINLAALIPGSHLKDAIFWSTIAFAFSGVESASVMAGEIRDAKKIIPPAILLSGVVMAILYIGATVSVLIAVPQKEVSGLQGITQAIEASERIPVAASKSRGASSAGQSVSASRSRSSIPRPAES